MTSNQISVIDNSYFSTLPILANLFVQFKSNVAQNKVTFRIIQDT